MPKSVPALVGLLLLIVVGGLAGLSATALRAAPGTPDSASPAGLPRPARIGDRYGYVNGDGRIVIPPRYEVADTFSDGLALVRQRGRFGYIDVRGDFAIPPAYLHALPFRDGFAAVREEGEWLFLDRQGRKVAGSADARPPLAARDDSAF